MAEPGSPSRWLLVLGSNAPDADARLDVALAMLGQHGAIERRSTRLDGDDVAARGPRYLNQLVLLAATADAAALRADIKRIEQQQGRSAQRLAAGVCDLDIDVLARFDAAGVPVWLADKPLAIPAVREALRQWGLAVD